MLTNDAGLWQYLPEVDAWRLLDEGPRRATHDFAPLAALRAAGHRFFDVLGTKRVAGHECVRVLVGAPPGSPLAVPTERDHAELCVHAGEVVLEERWVIARRQARHVVATDFQPNAGVDDVRPEPAVDRVASGTAGIPAVEPLDDGFRAQLPGRVTVPEGFDYVAGRKVTVRVGDAPGPTTTIELYRSGDKLLEVANVDGGLPAGRRLALGDRVVGVLQLDLAESTVTIDLGDGHLLRLRAADPDLLTRVARTVQRPPLQMTKNSQVSQSGRSRATTPSRRG